MRVIQHKGEHGLVKVTGPSVMNGTVGPLKVIIVTIRHKTRF